MFEKGPVVQNEDIFEDERQKYASLQVDQVFKVAQAMFNEPRE